MPKSRKFNIDYSKVKLHDTSDVKVRADNLCYNSAEKSIRWTAKSWEHHYEGNYFRECEHGVGTYIWDREKNKTIYEGKFYANNLHGYGRVSYNDGSIFEGLFKTNLRFGPGIFTYGTGEQDVGIWDSKHLVRLSQIIYPEWVPKLARTVNGKAKMLRYRKIVPIKKVCTSETNLNTIENEAQNVQNLNSSISLYSDCVRDPNSTFFNKKLMDDNISNDSTFYIDVLIPDNDVKFVVDDSGTLSINTSHSSEKASRKDDIISAFSFKPRTNKVPVTDLVAWNNNEFSMEILQFTFLNRDNESLFIPHVGKILAGDRVAFRTAGILEQNSVCYLKSCSDGNAKQLERLIYKSNVYPNVCDAKGNSAVVYAASRDQHNVLKLLPGLGVDFNQFNDESLTALNVVLLKYISKLNRIIDWEVAFILPLVCSASQLDTGKLFQWNIRQPSMKINVVNVGDESKFNNSLCSPNILHWTKSESKLLENYNYMNLRNRARYDKLMSTKKPCIFIFTPRVIEKRHGNEDIYAKIKKNLTTDKKKKCPEKKSSVAKKKDLKTEREHDKTTIASSINEPPQGESLEVLEQTIMLLLKGGSIPQWCEVPLPVIFLGVLSLNSKIVEGLLKYKADPNARTPECIGYLTPLHFLMCLRPSRELLDIAKLLLNYGADPNLRASPNHWDQLKVTIQHPNIGEDSLGMTPLHNLCIRQDLDIDISGYFLTIAKMLLINKANPNLLYCGHTPLSLAMLNGKKCMIKALLETGRVNPNQKLASEIGVPLTLYCNASYLEYLPIEVAMSIMDLITEYGANPLNTVFDEMNALEFIRINKSGLKFQNPLLMSVKFRLSQSIQKICPQFKESTAATKDDRNSKTEVNNTRNNYFFALEKHLHDLTNLALVNNIFGTVVRQIYMAMYKPLDTRLEYLKKLNTKIVIPNFEKATEVFGKMADAHLFYYLDKDMVKATLEYTLERDYIDAEQSEVPSVVDETDNQSVQKNQNFVCPKTSNKSVLSLKSVKEMAQGIDTPQTHLSKHNLDKLVDYIMELSTKEIRDSSSKVIVDYPEFDRQFNKYDICFECHNRKDVKLFTCPGCELVKFCSQRCNYKNNSKKTIHKCNDLYYNRLQILADGKIDSRTAKSEKSMICPPKTDQKPQKVVPKCVN